MTEEVFPLKCNEGMSLVPKQKAMTEAPEAFTRFLDQFSSQEQAQLLLDFVRILGNNVIDLAHVTVMVLDEEGITESTLIEEFRDKAENIEQTVSTAQVFGLSPHEARQITGPLLFNQI